MSDMKKITKDLIANFKEYLVNEEKSKATVEKYLHDVTVFYVWLGDRELTKALMLEYKEIITESYAPASTNSHISSINSFFDFLGWHDCKVKTLKIQRQIFASKEKELTKAEYERLLKAATDNDNERLYLVMQAICSTGIRVSELKFITVEAVKCGQANISCKGKMRVVLLPKSCAKF